MTPLLKKDFIGLDDWSWLYTGAESPLHHGVLNDVQGYMQERTRGPLGREFNAEIEASCRQQLARLLGGRQEDIAILSNASEAISAVLGSLRVQPGQNIVLHDLEYPAAVLGSLALQERGVEIRIIPHRDWHIETDDFSAHVDENTRIVVTSHASYLSGTRFDYQSLYRRLKTTKTLLLLDATQTLGVVPVDMNDADFVISSSYKWLLGMHGVGVLGINPRRTQALAPATAGWRSVEDLFSPRRFEALERYADARRFEMGYPAFATVAALNFSAGLLLECGVERIEQHVLSLGQKAIDGLKRLGLQVMTPEAPSQRAGNIAFVCPRGEAVARHLFDSGVIVWGGDGRVRLSIHGFNDEADIDRALHHIENVLGS